MPTAAARQMSDNKEKTPSKTSLGSRAYDQQTDGVKAIDVTTTTNRVRDGCMACSLHHHPTG
jgi:hypothetical protein